MTTLYRRARLHGDDFADTVPTAPAPLVRANRIPRGCSYQGRYPEAEDNHPPLGAAHGVMAALLLLGIFVGAPMLLVHIALRVLAP